jgi:hypothetical protein
MVRVDYPLLAGVSNLDDIEQLNNARVTEHSELLDGISCKGDPRLVVCDIEGKYAAVGAVFLET